MFLILTFGMLVSCGSDDSSDSNAVETDIIGTWELISSTANGLKFFESTECQTLLIYTATNIDSTEFYDYEDGNGCVYKILKYFVGPDLMRCDYIRNVYDF